MAAAAGLGAVSPAHAGEATRPPIVGGSAAARCEWPSAVMLYDGSFLCTGTLVHPRIVLYAAHCGVDFTRVEFGERLGEGYAAEVSRCRRAIATDEISPMDYAYCELARPVDGVPIAPVLYGCEADILTPGREVVIVGFGEGESEDAGVKRAATTTFGGTAGGMLVIGGDGVSPSFGDSGGPAFVRLDDGTWRAFGIVSGGKGPGMTSYYVDMRNAAAWVEQQSGHDISPCHSPSGTWQVCALAGVGRRLGRARGRRRRPARGRRAGAQRSRLAQPDQQRARGWRGTHDPPPHAGDLGRGPGSRGGGGGGGRHGPPPLVARSARPDHTSAARGRGCRSGRGARVLT